MFNPLTPSEMLLAIGKAARDVAKGDDSLTVFSRGQLMSSYSACRHLAVEIDSFGPEISSFCADVAEMLEEIGSSGSERLKQLSDRLSYARDVREVGEAVCLILDELRCEPDPVDQNVLKRLHSRLRALADREVELFAEGIEQGKP